MNHRGAAMTSGLRFLLDTFSRDTAWHFLCSVTIRNHTWLFCTYSHCFFVSPFLMSHSHSLRPVYVEKRLLNIPLSLSSPFFMPWGRLCSCQYDQGTQHHVNVVFCNLLAESRLKLVSTYPGVLKRGLHIYYLLIYLRLLWCHLYTI